MSEKWKRLSGRNKSNIEARSTWTCFSALEPREMNSCEFSLNTSNVDFSELILGILCGAVISLERLILFSTIEVSKFPRKRRLCMLIKSIGCSVRSFISARSSVCLSNFNKLRLHRLGTLESIYWKKFRAKNAKADWTRRWLRRRNSYSTVHV